MADRVLELLEAITEARVANPALRPSVLASLRLAAGAGCLRSGRLITLRHDGEPKEIIGHGEAAQDEAADRLQAAAAAEAGRIERGATVAVALRRGRRVHAILLADGADPGVLRLLGELFLQWVAFNEFAVLEKEELLDENHHLREELRERYHERNIICVSGGFRSVLDAAARAAASSATVLIQGETGTGKELVARLVHDRSPRVNQAFIAVNCGALSDSLLETELFGHVKGAFTGAIEDRKGRFEAAHGGTIFLDEIGEVSPAMQVRLLRVLQEMEVVRVGDTKARKLDVRVIAATNRDLEAEVRSGRFRADLFYRLNVVHLQIPPLRSRKEDIPHLVERFIGVHSQRNCRYIETVRKDVMSILVSYPWPGNVRELENCIEKMVVMSPGRELTADLLPLAIMAYVAPEAPALPGGPAAAPFEQRVAEWMRREAMQAQAGGQGELYEKVRRWWERHLFDAVLSLSDENKSRAALVLGITRNTLAARLKDISDTSRTWKV